jgi:hypothetical protein
LSTLVSDVLRDPEVLRFVDESERWYPSSANEADAVENRQSYDRMCAAFRTPRPLEVAVRDWELTTPAPEPPVQLREYWLVTTTPKMRQERLAEICALLAAGLCRLRARQSEIPLDSSCARHASAARGECEP